MQFQSFHLCHWLLNTPYRALDRAYKATKRVRNIHTNYVLCKSKPAFQRFGYNIELYIDSVLDESWFQIYWGLLEFKVSRCVLSRMTNLISQQHFNLPIKAEKTRFSLQSIDMDQSLIFCNLNPALLRLVNRKLAWIEAALADLNMLKNGSSMSSISLRNKFQEVYNLSLPISIDAKPKGVPYESVGLVPRSITRTFARFQTELSSQSVSVVLPEFRLAKYQATASVQYMACLIVIPWVLSTICKTICLQPLVETYWDTMQTEVFLNASQEQKALSRLQQIEELLWLDIVVASAPHKHLQDIAGEIHNKTIELVDVYNRESINTILNLLTDWISITCLALLLTWGKKRLAIFNSWIQELFYSLSDTMKAFFILLITDLCIGFHSPHGWEIIITLFLEHIGFAHNKYVISCFVSTFPVILDTVLKYWIFRHLNRISPSIVVTYHTMNE
uniref:Chloroplast envelope membrane protein n=1 Tax=Zygnema circumcarinatum TaxID=35869 RepID=A0A6N0GXC3_ZYGCR|nr:chloroplast envelope membrane protein [Zygnema circumcarinatum]